MTSDPQHLTHSTNFSGSDQVHMGNGQGLAITCIGSSKFTSPSHPQTTLALNDLLLVPSITKNLVSVSKFANDNWVYFEFHPTCCFVKCQDLAKFSLKDILTWVVYTVFSNCLSFQVLPNVILLLILL